MAGRQRKPAASPDHSPVRRRQRPRLVSFLSEDHGTTPGTSAGDGDAAKRDLWRGRKRVRGQTPSSHPGKSLRETSRRQRSAADHLMPKALLHGDSGAAQFDIDSHNSDVPRGAFSATLGQRRRTRTTEHGGANKSSSRGNSPSESTLPWRLFPRPLFACAIPYTKFPQVAQPRLSSTLGVPGVFFPDETARNLQNSTDSVYSLHRHSSFASSGRDKKSFTEWMIHGHKSKALSNVSDQYGSMLFRSPIQQSTSVGDPSRRDQEQDDIGEKVDGGRSVQKEHGEKGFAEMLKPLNGGRVTASTMRAGEDFIRFLLESSTIVHEVRDSVLHRWLLDLAEAKTPLRSLDELKYRVPVYIALDKIQRRSEMFTQSGTEEQSMLRLVLKLQYQRQARTSSLPCRL